MSSNIKRPKSGETGNDLLCKNGCGFFGNPEWDWFCSKCWREHQQRMGHHGQRRRSTPNSPVKSPVRQLASASFGGSASSPSTKEKLSLRKTLMPDLRKNKSLQGPPPENVKSHLFNKSKSQDLKSAYARDLPPESRVASNELAKYLNTRVDRPAIADVSRQVKAVVDRVQRDAEVVDIEDLSTTIQNFYQMFLQRLQNHQNFQGLSDNDRQTILALTEKYITVASYRHLFCPATTSDEEKDLELQNKIRSLNWLSTKDLGCAIDESSQEVRDLLHEAINDLLQMDGKMAPQEKLECLLKSCKNVFEMLRISNDRPASADDFLPCLIFICLKANPPRIQSNINYITRFCNEDKVRMGEAGYFFANLCCALTFIENLSADSINMDPAEFSSYVSGEAVPPGSWRSSLLNCEGFQTMSANIKTLAEIKSRHDSILSEAHILLSNMKTFEKEMAEDVQAVLEKTKYQIRKPGKIPVKPDDELEVETTESLPQPLIPKPLLQEPLIPISASGAGGGLPDPFSEKPKAISSESKISKGIEDFFNSSQNSSLAGDSSLLDLSAAAKSFDAKLEPEGDNVSLLSTMSEALVNRPPAYEGFSTQNINIPSIACDNNDKARKKSSRSTRSSRSSSPRKTKKDGEGSKQHQQLLQESQQELQAKHGGETSQQELQAEHGGKKESQQGQQSEQGSETRQQGQQTKQGSNIEIQQGQQSDQGGKKESQQGQQAEHGDTAAKVLGAVFDVVDNLL